MGATKAVQRAEATPEVTACHRATGSDCVVLLVRAQSVEHLGEVLEAYATFGQVTTSVILASPILGRAFSAYAAKGAGGSRAAPARSRTASMR